MKTKRKILAFLMALIMIIGLLPVSAFAENDLPATNTLDIMGIVEWNDGNDEQGERPEKITVRLMANNTEHASQEVRESEYGLWLFSFENLPAADAQGDIDYTITVDGIPEYTTKVEKQGDSGFRVTNTLNGYAPKYNVTITNNGTTDKATAAAGETVTITADPPAEGKAFVQWAHVDGVDYDRADSVTTTFTMPSKDVELTPVYADILIPDIADRTYTGEAIKPRFSFFSGVRLDGVDRLLIQDMHYDVTYDKNIDAGEATLTVTMKAPSAGSKTATFKILPVDIEMTTGSATKDEYDGTPLTCQTGAEITGLLSGETATVRATGSQTNVGTSQNTYAIDWGTAKAGNYKIAKETLGTLTVASPKPVTVTANDASKPYGETDPDLSATVKGLVGSDTVKYMISRDAGEDEGTYAITPTGQMTQGNYTVSFVPGTFTITPAVHVWKEATCTEPKTCKKCGLTEGKPLGHKYGEWTKLNNAQHQRVCEHDATHVEKADHSWDAGKVTKKATEKQTGIKIYTCKVCKATKTEPIPKLKPSAPKVSGKLLPKMTAKKKSVTISWNKIKGVAGYDIFFARCNHDKKKIVPKKAKTIKGNKTFKWTKSGLKKGTAYKAYIKAYVMKNGKKSYVRTSPLIHSYTGNGTKKCTNAKSVSVNKTKVTLKKGKTFKIKAKVSKVKKNKKLMPKGHAATLRYMTSNKKIATVSKSGKIKAKAKGTCYIYVFAHNGVSKRIKITVK